LHLGDSKCKIDIENCSATIESAKNHLIVVLFYFMVKQKFLAFSKEKKVHLVFFPAKMMRNNVGNRVP